jgi:hypothetical protein
MRGVKNSALMRGWQLNRPAPPRPATSTAMLQHIGVPPTGQLQHMHATHLPTAACLQLRTPQAQPCSGGVRL